MDEAQELGIDVQLPRKVEELVKLDTYQDMTDEEIELVVQFRIEQALIDDTHLKLIEERRAQEAIGAQVLAEAQYNALQLVSEAMSCKPELQVIPYDA